MVDAISAVFAPVTYNFLWVWLVDFNTLFSAYFFRLFKINNCMFLYTIIKTYQYYLKQQLFVNWSNRLRSYTYKNMNTKPPNILVYTGSNCPKLFKEIEINILKCLKTDSYLVYHLLESEVNESPWMDNSILLVVSSTIIKSSILKTFDTFLNNFGNVLLICSLFDDYFVGNECHQILTNNAITAANCKDFGELVFVRGKYSYLSKGIVLCHDNNKKSLIQKTTCNNNILITSEIYLDQNLEDPNFSSKYGENRHSMLKYILNKEFGLEASEDNYALQLTPGYYINDNKNEIAKLMNELKLYGTSSEKPIFHKCKLKKMDDFINLPIYLWEESFQLLTFDEKIYFSKLNTNIYGHHLVYFPVITSTMEVAEQLLEFEGIVIVAGYQISGKGRGTNKWLNPKGCATFTLHFTVPLNSHLGKKMSLLQHIASLAVILGIKTQPIYKDLELKIKWPNDIYHNKTKVGGLIVTSTVLKDSAYINIGWGINVENSHPTSCLNDVIDKYNSENNSSLPHLCVEELVAVTTSQMEFLVKECVESGFQNFFTLYYDHWMHSNQEVTVKSLNELGTIIGLDDYGFLKVKVSQNKTIVLQPDGNHFDIMKNLIHTK